MLTTADRFRIERLVEAYPGDVAFQILAMFQERTTPAHYIYAGELIGKSKAEKPTTNFYSVFSN